MENDFLRLRLHYHPIAKIFLSNTIFDKINCRIFAWYSLMFPDISVVSPKDRGSPTESLCQESCLPVQKFSRGSMMQLVSAELFSRAHGLAQSSATTNQPRSASGNQAASPRATSVNKATAAPASPKAVSISKQNATAASPKASNASKRRVTAASPVVSSVSKRKADVPNEQPEAENLDTKSSNSGKKASRLDRKPSAGKRKHRDEETKSGVSLSPSKRQRGGEPASLQKGKANKPGKQRQGNKAGGKKDTTSDSGDKKDTQQASSAKKGSKNAGHRGVDPSSKAGEKKGFTGKRKRAAGKVKEEEDAKPQSSDSLPQKAKQAQKAASVRKSRAAEQTPKSRCKPFSSSSQKATMNPFDFMPAIWATS